MFIRFSGAGEVDNFMAETSLLEMASARKFKMGQVAERTTRQPAMVGFLMLLFLMSVFAKAAHAADGKEIATNGNGRAPACSMCHGEQGEGRPDAAYPRLAGLDSEYLVRQLNAFAEGGRDSETMHPIAKALSAEERQAVAKFYAGLTAPAVAEPNKADDNIIAIGATLANRGDWPKGLPGCGQCHGAAGQGVGGTFPKLPGQSAEYIANQLKAWKDGKRTNDPLHLMAGISGKLNDRQVAAVAAYYASLPAIPTTLQGLKP
jgi:cytochrome c553